MSGKQGLIAAAVLAAVAGGAFVAWEQWGERGDEGAQLQPPPVPPAPPPAVPELPPQPVISHPIEPVAEQLDAVPPETSPVAGGTDEASLEDDGSFLRNLLALVPADAASLLMDDAFIRRIVVTVDNLPGPKVSAKLRPFRAAEGVYVVDGDALSGRSMSDQNAARYAPYVSLLLAVDLKRAVGLYVRAYPKFQAAYRELGYPAGYFNDRLVAVIDHMLATPPLPRPVALVQPKVMYEYADPQLEALSAGQKLMLRLAPAQADQVKARLRQLRGLVTATGAQ